MAKAPKKPSSKTTSPKPDGAKPDQPPVEDAVVIEEIAAEPPHAPEKAAPPPPPKDEKPEPEPEKGAASPAPAPPAPAKKRRGISVLAGLLLGGAAAALIGFAAARYWVPEGWPFPGVPPEEDPIVAVVEAQGAELSGLAAKVAAMEADTTLDAMNAEISAALAGLSAEIGAASARLDEIEARLSAVERLAPEGSAAAQLAAEAYEKELAALREMFEGELAEIDAAQASAETIGATAAEEARAAAARSALAQVRAALDTGGPFETALAEFTESSGRSAPPALGQYAAEGVPTMSDLQAGFPAAARAALDASVRAAVESGEIGRFSAFLRTQLGTRSLEPKEGDDADAVLSRAEEALRQGDLPAAFAELEAMPEAAAPALSDWIAAAKTRQAAVSSAVQLSQDLDEK